MKFSVIIRTVSGAILESDTEEASSYDKIKEIRNHMKQFKNYDFVEIMINDESYIFNPDNIEFLRVKEYV